MYQDIVLTAAHCGDRVQDKNVFIGALENKTVRDIAELRQIVDTVTHPSYDAILLKLNTPSTLALIDLTN